MKISNTNVGETSYVIDILRNNKIIYLPSSPTSMSEGISSSYNQENLIGSDHPIITYSNTSARQLSISFLVTPDILPSSYGKDISSYLSDLKQLEYPIYNGALVKSPNCSITLPGITLTGVCNSVSIDYRADVLYSKNSQPRLAADVSLSFLEVLDRVSGYTYIKNNSYLDLQPQDNLGDVKTEVKNNVKYNIGDRVKINKVYVSSTASSGVNPLYNTGVITRILEGRANPYLLDNGNLGWVNDNCIIGKV